MPSIDSNPQNAAIVRPPSSSHPGRRMACDRCRGQKLRCIREDQNGNTMLSGKCLRCTTADTTCIFSTPLRAGRHYISSTINSPIQRKGMQRLGQGGPRAKASNAGPNSPGAKHTHSYGSEGEHRPNRTSVNDVEGEMDTTYETYSATGLALGSSNSSSVHEGLSFYSGSSGAEIAWDNSSMTTLCDGDYNLETFGPDYDWSFLQPPTLPKDIHVSAASLPSRGSCRASYVDLGQNNRRLHEIEMSESPRSTSGTTALFDQASVSQAGMARDIMNMDEVSMNFIMRDLNESGRGGKPVSKETKSMPSVNEAQHQRMQQISELAMNLYILITTEDQRHHPPSTSPTTPSSLAINSLNQLVGNALRYSTTFLRILKSFHPSKSSLPSTRPLTKQSTLCSSDSDASDSDSASILSDSSTTTTDEHIQSPRASSPRRNRSVTSKSAFSNTDDIDPSSKPISVDMTTIFELLTCYIRIMHLHSILYARILDHLLAYSPPRTHNDNTENGPASSPPQLPPIFPNIQVGGFPLNDFGIFQIKMILQISTHALGEIEIALGLPDGFRISRKTPGVTGVLETSVSVHFIETMMREIETTMRKAGGERGYGTNNNDNDGSDNNENENGNNWRRGPANGASALVGNHTISSIRENLVKLRRLLRGTIDI